MITEINKINDNKVVVSFDNREDLIIVSDDGKAWSIFEELLSPRWDMTYTEFQNVLAMEDEITEIIPVEYVA